DTATLLGGNPEPMAWAKLRGQYASRLDVPADIWHRTVMEIREQEAMAAESQQVVETGGLHVLGTERHEAARIDRQLAGRAARQGDPGSSQFFLSLEDELLEGLGPYRQVALRQTGEQGGNRDWDSYLRQFLHAQRRVERRHY